MIKELGKFVKKIIDKNKKNKSYVKVIKKENKQITTIKLDKLSF